MTEIKKLGFGCMRLPLLNGEFNQVDKPALNQMVDYFLEHGFTYFDTAWFYHKCQSEAALKECLVERYPRSSFQLADKMPLALINEEKELPEYFNTQLERCGVSYFDYYLVHDMGKDRFAVAEKTHVFDFLAQKKADGMIKQLGFSFHDTPEVLEQLLTAHPDVDFVQLQLNYLDWDSEVTQSRRLWEIAKQHNKPIIVMEPVKGGMLAELPEEAAALLKAAAPDKSLASWAIRFAASQENVLVVLSGMSNMEQLKDNIACMENFQPLSAAELDLLQQVVDIINSKIAIPCTGCAYCINNCPMEIPIPKYFSLYNSDLLEPPDKAWTQQGVLYDHFAQQQGKASDCCECGQCEKMCPQHLPIRELLKTVAKHFEE